MSPSEVPHSSRLRFSRDELPEETIDAPKRKQRWQLDEQRPTESDVTLTSQQALNDEAQKPANMELDTLVQEIPEEVPADSLPHSVQNYHSQSVPDAQGVFTRLKKRPQQQTTEPKKRATTLSFEENASKQPSFMKHKPQHKASALVSDGLHYETWHSNEDGNAGVTAADQGISAVECMARTIDDARYSHQLRSHRKTVQTATAPSPGQSNGSTALQNGTNSKLMHGSPASTSATASAGASASGAASNRPHASSGSNPLSKVYQKRTIRKGYIAARSGKTANGTYKTAKGTKNAAKKTTSVVEKLGQMMIRRKSSWMILLLIALLAVVMSLVSSCAPLAQSVITSATMGTYPAEEDDIRAAERAYSNMERELQRELDRYERYHPGYDEYNIEQDEIWHDPYALIAIISARFNGEEWTIDTAYPVLELYFDLQYDLEEEIVRRTRYDEDGNPYTYTICNVTLTNKNLSHMPVYSMSREPLGMYALYMSTLGNMPDLFSGAHCSELRDPVIHEVPQACLDADPNFALLITEANKYVGYPYVWGGDSPETSFDCSGFLSYVFTTTGVRNTGRLGATGLYGVCDPVAPEDARPGDMVFFDGTMGDDVGGITHCGLYVGDGWFIHCGNPIGYAELDDWRSNFYGFGRAY